MIDFYNGQITDILPDNLAGSPVVSAVSYAISNMVKKIVDCSVRAGIYASIDMLDEEILDLLAVELRTKYYGDWLSLQEKRAVVKKTLLWYCMAGTLFTVQELTDFVFQDARIEEWFQYDSAPFLFRLMVNVISQDISLEKYLKFLQALYEVKNTRSHLEAVIFSCHKRVDIRTVAAGGLGNIIRVKTRTVRRIGAAAGDYAAGALFVNQNVLVKADNSIKKKEVYVMTEDGEKERVHTGSRAFVRTR